MDTSKTSLPTILRTFSRNSPSELLHEGRACSVNNGNQPHQPSSHTNKCANKLASLPANSCTQTKPKTSKLVTNQPDRAWGCCFRRESMRRTQHFAHCTCTPQKQTDMQHRHTYTHAHTYTITRHQSLRSLRSLFSRVVQSAECRVAQSRVHAVADIDVNVTRSSQCELRVRVLE